MKEYTIILDDEEVDILMGCLEERPVHIDTSVASVEDAIIRGVLKQLSILKAKNEEDYE
tara:strand:+ start:1583 stop:1759 length:177 start_codon:yes stop_codon:yes gene_type:complete